MKTYVLRLWEAAEPALPADPLRGIVEEVATGRSEPFVGIEELVRLLAPDYAADGPVREPDPA